MSFADLKTDYAGRKKPMFWLALKTGLLTVVTAGFYRFWMKTRMRRYYWSAIRPGGLPLEYVGRPTEKMLGFFTAVVFLAFYIGIVNLILMYFSFSLFQGNAPAYAVSVVGITPLIFFAQYRARRYVLARTRWRGIRFGLEPGVAGFVWRSLLHWGLTLATLGLYWPVKTFYLEKYRADRTHFGTHRMEQGGTWRLLIGAAKHMYIGAAILGVSGVIGGVNEEPGFIVGGLIGAIWMGLGWFYWKAESFKRLTEAKTLGEAGFRCNPSMGSVLGIYAGGSAAIGGIIIGLFIALGVVMAGLLAATGNFSEAMFDEGNFGQIPTFILAIGGAASYFALFIFYGVLGEVFIKLPLNRHFAETTEIVNPLALRDVRQRDRDEFAEAEGFADALPLGDAF